VGAPAALDFTVLNLGYLGVMGLLGAGGGVAVAAHSIGMRVLVLAFVPSRAIAQAAAALVGQHLGAECRPCAARVVRLALGQNMVLLALVVTMLWFGAEPLVAALGVDSAGELASATTTWLRIIALSLPILAVNITFVGMMQGAGLTSTSLGINAFSTLLVQLPAGWLAGYGLGLGPPGVWLCIPIGFGLRATMGAWVYRLWLR
jgi:MATE family multidrug resistance protein